jgi:hypothetical protein
LVDKIDPNGRLHPANSSRESYIKVLIDKAEGIFLDKERAKCAKEVRDAGNRAIHDLLAFRRKDEKRMGEIVDDTRKIVIDLYA